MGNYTDKLNDLELLFSEAFEISIRTTGRGVGSQREYYASLIFTKIVLTLRAILKLLPKSSFDKNGNLEVWDISSVNSLTRSLIDTYNVLFYLTVDNIPKNEKEFRFALWKYHSEKERLKMLELIPYQNQKLQSLRNEINDLRNELLESAFYKSLDFKERKRIEKRKKRGFI